MIKSIFGIAASRIIIDAKTNQVSIIDVFEGIGAQSFPVILPRLSFMFRLQRENAESAASELTLKYFVNEKPAMNFPVNVNFQDRLTTRAIIEFEGFMIPSHGVLNVVLLDDEKELEKLTFNIDQIDIEQPIIRTNSSE